MMSDTFDILDAKIINFGVDYTLVSAEGVPKTEVLSECNRRLQELFSISAEIGEAFLLNDVYKALNDMESVVDVTSVRVRSLSGGVYSSVSINIDDNLSLDGRTILIPSDHIYEIKFPNTDIRGTVL